jgi:hypothetical protein
MALLVRKKGLSFERLKEQFIDATTRNLLLSDTVFGQVTYSFNEIVDKSMQQILNSLQCLYSQLNKETHEENLRQFITFLNQEASEIEKPGFCHIEDEVLVQYWEGILASFSLNSEIDKLREILTILPFSYQEENQHWKIALAGLSALKCSSFSIEALNSQITLKAPEKLIKEIVEQDFAKIPSGINLSMNLNDSSINVAKVAILTVGKPSEFRAWHLPSANLILFQDRN